ncbi:MAG: hypothetical protein Q4G51_00485 [Dermatophilus congolensis]|nr:hypothetical protein [Dermatophilus congolensis]
MQELVIPTRFGDFQAIDHGGDGPNVLALHDLFISNAASWLHVAERLDGRARLVALDREGHGQTRISAEHAIDACAALADIVEYLGWVGDDAPVLAGCGSGGWDLTAALICGGVKAKGLVSVEAAYCVPADELLGYLAEFAATDDVGNLWGILGLGWTGTEAEMRDEMARLIALRESSWIVSEASPSMWEATVRRSFVRDGDTWRRAPATEAMTGLVWERVQQEPKPSPESYARLDVPATFLLAEGGLYGVFGDEIDAMVAGDPRRRMRLLPAVNNLLSTHPGVIADEILAFVDSPGPEVVADGDLLVG